MLDIQIILLEQQAPPRKTLILKFELVKKLQGVMIRINLDHWAVGWQVNLKMLKGQQDVQQLLFYHGVVSLCRRELLREESNRVLRLGLPFMVCLHLGLPHS